MAGSDVPLLGSNIPVKVPCQQGQPSAIKLSFIQFEDGSTWGDDQAKQQIMAARAAVQDYLTRIRLAYASGDVAKANALIDEKVYVNSAGKPVHSAQLALVQKHLQDARSNDPQGNGAAVLQEIDSRLTAAKAHAAWATAH
jgi:hypothetical protein